MDFYPEPQSLDLRDEFHNILFGTYDLVGAGRPVLIRFLTDQHCVCWDGLTGSPDTNCGYCQGEGYLFREEQHIVYVARDFGNVLGSSTGIGQQNQIAKQGFTDSQKAIAWAEYNVFPDYEKYTRPGQHSIDKLYELKVDDNGKAVFPLVRTAKWNMRSVTPMHGDFGRIEYFELGLEKQNI